MEYHKRRAYGVLGGSMKEDRYIVLAREIMKIKKELELLKKENKVLRERIELLENLVHSDVEFIPDFIAEEGN